MIAPVYQILKADSAVSGIVGTDIFRAEYPQDRDNPFVVWQVVTGQAFNSVSCTPDMDEQRIQLDCYSRSQAEARKLMEAVRNALEKKVNIIRGPDEFGRETETRLFRWSMDAIFFMDR